MSDKVFACGEWHERHDDWRSEVDLGTCDQMTAYAAGRDDGYRQAVTEFRGLWQLLLRLDSAWDQADVRAVAEPRPAPVTEMPRQRHLRVVRT